MTERNIFFEYSQYTVRVLPKILPTSLYKTATLEILLDNNIVHRCHDESDL